VTISLTHLGLGGVTLRGQEWVALYDASRIVEKLALDMDYVDAMEYFDFNIQGAYLGGKDPYIYLYGSRY